MPGFYRWMRPVFKLVIIAGVLFVLLTLLAMIFYPGGTVRDRMTVGYSFFYNFFSDLGRTVSRSGQPNPVAMVLFIIGLCAAGASLVLFSLAFPPFFAHTLRGRLTSLPGAFFGFLAGFCFIGIALYPANINNPVHTQFVLWAFRLFPLAAVFFTVSILLERSYPRRYALVFAIFTLLLFAYMGLLVYGPSVRTMPGLLVQVTGQKVIAYTAVISIGIQAWGGLRMLDRSKAGFRDGEISS